MSTQLSVSQGNALVYSTLSAFFLVGLYAGYRCKTERDFFSGIRTQGAFALCLNWIASSGISARCGLPLIPFLTPTTVPPSPRKSNRKRAVT
ncbi:hypothetical protein A4X06_0g348 [Tilletia controversa]|uniref:Uncharacterized protein n=1 Tax=Tilletia controversa TaxID=13291 RepID=A0A8X7N083_9BASI|nr:hypothetical protein A4X06_0g348 [Tilletia controversa]